MSIRLQTVALLIAYMLTAGAARADKVHDDIKHRFRLTLPEGWKWRPEPGDAQGEWFRKVEVGAIANVAVRVMTLDRYANTPKAMADHVEQVLREEPGYRRLAETSVNIAARQALRREYVSFVAGSAETQKRAEDFFFVNGEYGYWIHFETLAEAYDLFQRDLQQLLTGFIPIAGGQRAALLGGKTSQLVGTWQKVGDSLQLDIRSDGSYTLGPISGLYQVEANALILVVPNQSGQKPGEEKFLYTLSKTRDGEELKLSGAQLSEPIRYKRIGQKKNTSLVGVWRARDNKNAVLKLTAGGTFTFGKQSGMFRQKADILVLKERDGGEIMYSIFLDGDELKLSGADLTQEVIFERD